MKRQVFNSCLMISFLLFAKQTNCSLEGCKIIQYSNSPITYLTGNLNINNQDDTLTLFCNGQFYTDVANQIEREATCTLTAIAHNGNFVFKIPSMNGPFHISLYTSSKREQLFFNIAEAPKLHYFLLEPDDSIHVDFRGESLKFSGKGTELANVQYEIENKEKLMREVKSDFNKDAKSWMAIEDSILSAQLKILVNYKSKLSYLAFSILQADVIGKNRKWVYERIELASFNSNTVWGRAAIELFQNLKKNSDTLNVSGSFTLAPAYVEYQYQKVLLGYKFYNHLGVLPLDIDLFSVINSNYDGPLRDKLLTRWLKSMIRNSCAHTEYFENVLSVINTGLYKQIVEDWKRTYSKGAPVLDFAFQDSQDSLVRLSDFRGKVIFMDMWFTGCLSCIEVSKALKSVEEEFKNRSDVVFISLSIDRDKKRWLKSIKESPSDERQQLSHYTSATTRYLYTGGKGFNDEFISKYNPSGFYPQLLLIDKRGKIFSSDPPRPDLENGQEKLISKIKECLKEN